VLAGEPTTTVRSRIGFPPPGHAQLERGGQYADVGGERGPREPTLAPGALGLEVRGDGARTPERAVRQHLVEQGEVTQPTPATIDGLDAEEHVDVLIDVPHERAGEPVAQRLVYWPRREVRRVGQDMLGLLTRVQPGSASAFAARCRPLSKMRSGRRMAARCRS